MGENLNDLRSGDDFLIYNTKGTIHERTNMLYFIKINSLKLKISVLKKSLFCKRHCQENEDKPQNGKNICKRYI